MTQRVGVIVVHGIGEQRRFEHIDGQVRSVVAALQSRNGAQSVSVEIVPGQGAAFQADQDSWAVGPTVTVRVDDPTGPVEIDFHEVWWADVNEPYSLIKQIRFWLWGLTLWIFPGKARIGLPGAVQTMVPPVTEGLFWFWVRLRLFFVAIVAVGGAASVGMLVFVAQRLFKLDMPDMLRVFVNYVAGVKLYNQKQRLAGKIWPTNQDVLDSIGEPPRVSVRRRMIRVIADVALAKYDRWYVMAHSLGSVVAFNGLMETAYAWPGYLDTKRWTDLVDGGFAGPAGRPLPAGLAPTRPQRPVWLGPDDVVYRGQIFDRFHGLLTFGSPLEKFAAIWPANVPITTAPAFQPQAHWVNVYDPIDPVSGILDSFRTPPPPPRGRVECPTLENVGYKSGPVFLLNHLQYLEPSKNNTRDTLVDWVADWLVTAAPPPRNPLNYPRFYDPRSATSKGRSAWLWAWWIGVAIALFLAGGIVAPLVIKAIVAAWDGFWVQVHDVLTNQSILKGASE